MKNIKKRILILLSSCAFVALMLFNVSVSINGADQISDISLSGIEALAAIQSEGCGTVNNCYYDPSCTGACAVTSCTSSTCPHPEPNPPIGQGCHYCVD